MTPYSCPRCRTPVAVAQPLPATVHCPNCRKPFTLQPAAARSGAAPTMSMRTARPAAPPRPQGPPALLLAAAAGVLALLLLASVVVAIIVFTAGRGGQKKEIASGGTVDELPPVAKKDTKFPASLDLKRPDEPPDKEKAAPKLPPVPKKEAEPKKLEPKTHEPKPEPVTGMGDGNETKVIQSESGGLKIKVIETVFREKVKGESRLRLAVTPFHFDDMGRLLRTLGEGYKYTQLTEAELLNPNRLRDFDVIFLTCGGPNNRNPQLGQALRTFVTEGGTLYASDLRFDAIATAFPEYINPAGNGIDGMQGQIVAADVKDKGLEQVLGNNKVALGFDSPGWKPAAFLRHKCTVYLEGRYRTVNNAVFLAPLLIKFSHGDGSVIFTSFHNAKQNTQTAEKLLRYLVFTVVTASIEHKVSQTMVSGGFSPLQSRRIVTTADQPSASAVYHNKQAGPLRFALGFRDEGAKLKLTLTSPSGQKIEREGTSTFTIEIDNAPAGDWYYTITALKVPYQNFPFTLTVGEPTGRKMEKR